MARQMPDEEEGVPPPVTEAAMEAVITRLQNKKRAPVPDGVHGRVLATALGHLGDSLRELFDRCLRSGQFPGVWKDDSSRTSEDPAPPAGSCILESAGVWRRTVPRFWAVRLTARNKAALRAALRAIAVRVIRGYCTVSWAAATALAGDPPWELVTEVLAETYSYISGRRALGENPTLDGILRVRRIGQEALMRRWGKDLAGQPYGTCVTTAIRPVLERWMRRKRKPLNFRRTQVLTGHGCFGDYLCRTAQRELTTECYDCGAAVDSAQHTLEVCPRWAALRQGLTSVLGGDLSLPSVITAMLGDDESWKAIVFFCETVMSQKEADEWVREEAADVASIRGRRMGTFNLDSCVAQERIEFSFTPPYSPHFNGVAEAAVRSIKHHLIRLLHQHHFTYEELYTCLTQIESILNSRPLTPLSSDPLDFSALTPAHFLIRRPLTSVPYPQLTEIRGDGATRVADIKTKKGTIRRVFNNICPLPL
ncbi:unnamed protein product [Euphydryas editha]|uniref:Integrase catalytic domain-containing protein n=1 Tax=Euphydryas editha TaxID=104508 RepID=A0AAU9TNC8_EUPED|nr:unnamed protein product [Euphydryas editha]